MVIISFIIWCFFKTPFWCYLRNKWIIQSQIWVSNQIWVDNHNTIYFWSFYWFLVDMLKTSFYKLLIDFIINHFWQPWYFCAKNPWLSVYFLLYELTSIICTMIINKPKQNILKKSEYFKIYLTWINNHSSDALILN